MLKKSYTHLMLKIKISRDIIIFVTYTNKGKKLLLKHIFKKFWSLELLYKFSCGLHD